MQYCKILPNGFVEILVTDSQDSEMQVMAKVDLIYCLRKFNLGSESSCVEFYVGGKAGYSWCFSCGDKADTLYGEIKSLITKECHNG